MAQSRFRAVRVAVLVAVVSSAMLAGAAVTPAAADVTAVTGSAFGASGSIGLFGGPATAFAAQPTVSLPATGGNPSNSQPSIVFTAGPAQILSTGKVDVSTNGSLGASGSVTSTATVQNPALGGFTATTLSSSCTANESGLSGSTTVAGGRVPTSDPNRAVEGDEVYTDVPGNPAPNATFQGLVPSVATDYYRVVFNEQVRTANSITVNAAHFYLGENPPAQNGPAARGEVIIGQTVCGVTATAASTTTTTTAPGATTTTTAPGATTTTTAASATTTTTTGATTTTTTTVAPATTTTAGAGSTTTTTAGGTTSGVSGGAYGFLITVSLFGGAPATQGPTPAVTLPAAGSPTPISDSAATGTARFGPATLFTSDALEVSTQGTPGGTVTSSAKVSNVNRSGQEQLTASTVSSTCSASASGESGSTTITGGKLTTSAGRDLDSDADDTVVDIPASPAPNASFAGAIENIGDTFRVVLNEQTRTTGTITVNAVHLYLLGPTAVGELIIGQSRCGTTSTAAGAGAGGGGTLTAAGSGGGLASTGAAIAVFVALSLVLLIGGSTVTYWVAGVPWPESVARRMPWAARRLLR